MRPAANATATKVPLPDWSFNTPMAIAHAMVPASEPTVTMRERQTLFQAGA
jgi:hypothetical protein